MVWAASYLIGSLQVSHDDLHFIRPAINDKILISNVSRFSSHFDVLFLIVERKFLKFLFCVCFCFNLMKQKYITFFLFSVLKKTYIYL